MTSVASTIDCRLLCASVCAYSLDASGQFDPSGCQPYYDAAGYASTPVAFVAGQDDINACLVGTFAAASGAGGPAVVLAFRGTLPPTDPPTVPELLDWLNDFNAAPITPPGGIPGQVHGGFWDALMSLWPAAFAEVRKQLAAGGGTLPLYITGHSKGGGLASLAAAQCAWVEGITPAAVCTYASPMAADSTFAAAYNLLGFPDTRYEYTDDIVPHLPPSPLMADLFAPLPWIGPYFKTVANWNYNAVGNLRFINWSGQIVGDSFSLGWERFTSLFELLFELNFSQIADDHHATCGYGYMTYVCPTGVCNQTGGGSGDDDAYASAQPQEEENAGSTALERWRAARSRQITRRG
jgi:Lipase (class 3)